MKNDPVLALVQHDAMNPKPCVLCGEYTHSRSVYRPFNSQLYGAAEGKERLVVYPLCEDESPERDVAKIERCIDAQLALGKVDQYTA